MKDHENDDFNNNDDTSNNDELWNTGNLTIDKKELFE